jgi:hypothetical protein
MERRKTGLPIDYGGNNDEIIGILTAISIVSQRLAGRLVDLEKRRSLRNVKVLKPSRSIKGGVCHD